ncbi:MAG: LptA/OstA family protein [Candidatus Velthaea sp.]
MKFRILTAAAAGALLAAATLAAAPPSKLKPNTANPNAGGLQTKDFKIETPETQSNLNSGDFTMPRHVKFFRPGTDVVGDRAQGNYKAGVVTITGHVVLHDSGNSSEVRQSGAPAGSGPATLICDELQIDSRRKIYVANGNVRFVQGDRAATAQNGRLDQGAHVLDLSGNVHLTQGGTSLQAQTVHYDTLTKDVNTTGAPVILTQPAPPPQQQQQPPQQQQQPPPRAPTPRPKNP